MEQTRASFRAEPIEKTFKPLPYPENIVVVAKNPRLKQLKPSGMLDMSMELSLDWVQPQFESQISNYEIYTTSSFVCPYDRYGKIVGTKVDGSSTNFSGSFHALVAAPDTPVLVLVSINTYSVFHLLCCHVLC